MSDPQQQPGQSVTDNHETRLTTLENMFASRYTYIKDEVKGFWSKVNVAWQWFHGELYHWTAHAKDIAYALAALAVFIFLLKMVGLA